jgi:hypothetical protein
MFGMGPIELLLIVGVAMGLVVAIVVVAALAAKGRPSAYRVNCLGCGKLVPPGAASCPQCGRSLV